MGIDAQVFIDLSAHSFHFVQAIVLKSLLNAIQWSGGTDMYCTFPGEEGAYLYDESTETPSATIAPGSTLSFVGTIILYVDAARLPLPPPPPEPS